MSEFPEVRSSRHVRVAPGEGQGAGQGKGRGRGEHDEQGRHIGRRRWHRGQVGERRKVEDPSRGTREGGAVPSSLA